MRNLYTIKDINDSTILTNINNLNEAISLANNAVGAKVYDEQNKVIHVSTKQDESKKIVTSIKTIGQGVKLYRANIYKTATSVMPFNKVSGLYFIFDSKTVNGRYKVVDDRSKINKGASAISGYINVEDCN